MATRDLYNNIVVRRSLSPASRSAAANGASVDTRGFDSVVFALEVGAVADGQHQFTLQESDDDSTFTEIDSDDLDGTLPTITGDSPDEGANAVTEIGYKGSSRYVRVRVEGSDGSPSGSALSSAVVVLGHAHQRPTQ